MSRLHNNATAMPVRKGKPMPVSPVYYPEAKHHWSLGKLIVIAAMILALGGIAALAALLVAFVTGDLF